MKRYYLIWIFSLKLISSFWVNCFLLIKINVSCRLLKIYMRSKTIIFLIFFDTILNLKNLYCFKWLNLITCKFNEIIILFICSLNLNFTIKILKCLFRVKYLNFLQTYLCILKMSRKRTKLNWCILLHLFHKLFRYLQNQIIKCRINQGYFCNFVIFIELLL